MRHNKKFNHLGRQHGHRSAMLSNMATSLIMHKRIKTTVPKAKALRTFVEPLITKSKVDSTHSRRVVFSYLQNKDSVSELFREVAVKVADRPGGYTRILKLGTRMGDNADMCIIELVDYNENMLKDSKDSKSKSSRRRRRKKSSGDQAHPAQDTQAQNTEQDNKPEAATKEEPKAEAKTPKAETKKAAPKTDDNKAEPKAEKKAAPKKAEAKSSDKAEAAKEAPKKEEKKQAKPKAEKTPQKEDKKDADGKKDAEENK